MQNSSSIYFKHQDGCCPERTPRLSGIALKVQPTYTGALCVQTVKKRPKVQKINFTISTYWWHFHILRGLFNWKIINFVHIFLIRCAKLEKVWGSVKNANFYEEKKGKFTTNTWAAIDIINVLNRSDFGCKFTFNVISWSSNH